MGLLCELVVTTRERALTYASSEPSDMAQWREGAPFREFNGLTNLDFEMLWAILEEKEWDAERHGLINVALDENNEWWLFQFQDEYVRLLATLSPGALSSAAQAFCQSEGFSAEEDVLLVLSALVELSNTSIAQGNGLYMWCSL